MTKSFKDLESLDEKYPPSSKSGTRVTTGVVIALSILFWLFAYRFVSLLVMLLMLPFFAGDCTMGCGGGYIALIIGFVAGPIISIIACVFQIRFTLSWIRNRRDSKNAAQFREPPIS